MYKVGKTYRVRTVQVGTSVDIGSGNTVTLESWHGFIGQLPILTDLRADEDFFQVKFKHHLHINWQFVPQSFYDECVIRFGAAHELLSHVMLINAHLDLTMKVMGSHRLPCLRPAPPFHPLLNNAYYMPQLESMYACAALTNGKCPHQGAPRESMQEVDGVLVCPGHGLRWNKQTGKLAPRVWARRRSWP